MKPHHDTMVSYPPTCWCCGEEQYDCLCFSCEGENHVGHRLTPATKGCADSEPELCDDCWVGRARAASLHA